MMTCAQACSGVQTAAMASAVFDCSEGGAQVAVDLRPKDLFWIDTDLDACIVAVDSRPLVTANIKPLLHEDPGTKPGRVATGDDELIYLDAAGHDMRDRR